MSELVGEWCEGTERDRRERQRIALGHVGVQVEYVVGDLRGREGADLLLRQILELAGDHADLAAEHERPRRRIGLHERIGIGAGVERPEVLDLDEEPQLREGRGPVTERRELRERQERLAVGATGAARRTR